MSKLEKIVIAVLTAMLLINGYVLFSRSQVSDPDIIEPESITKPEKTTEGEA